MSDYDSYKAEPMDRINELNGILEWANTALVADSYEWVTLAKKAVSKLKNEEVELVDSDIVQRNNFAQYPYLGNQPKDESWDDYDDIIDELASWFDDSGVDDPDGNLLFGELKDWYDSITNAFNWPQDQIDSLDIEHLPPYEAAGKIDDIIIDYESKYIPIIESKAKIIQNLLDEQINLEENKKTKSALEGEEGENMEYTDDINSEKSIAQDIAERIVSTATRAIGELNQATASNATNIIKRYLMALKNLEDECADDSGMLPEDIGTIAAQTDDVTDVALRRFHSDIRSWDAYSVQREDAKLAFSKIASYWGKIVNVYKSSEPSRRKTAAKSYGVPNYRYKVGQMVKVGNRFGKVVGVSKEGGTGKQLYEVRIDGKDQTRKCGLKEISNAESKKKVTKSVSVKSDMSPDEAKKLLKEYATYTESELPDIKDLAKSAKEEFSKAGMDHINFATDYLHDLITDFPRILKGITNDPLARFANILIDACEALNIPYEHVDEFIYLGQYVNSLTYEAASYYNFNFDEMHGDETDPRWGITAYRGQNTIDAFIQHIANFEKWLDTFNSSDASKSFVRSQIQPYNPSSKNTTTKFQPAVGKYAEAGSLDDSYDIVEDRNEVDDILDSVGFEPGDFDFVLVKAGSSYEDEVWGGEGSYGDTVRVQRLS